MSLTSDFLDDPLTFAQANSICPPDDIDGYKGKLACTLDTSGYVAVGPSSGNDVTSIKYSRVMRSKKIGYIELYKDTRPNVGNNEGSGVIRLNTSFKGGGDARPVWFLPWDAGGAIVKLRIPEKGEHDPDPDIFLTAAINGCSVFVQGEPDSPTVYHAGGNTARSDHNDAARFWRHALQNHLKNSETGSDRGLVGGEVNKTHYVKTPGSTGNSTTANAEDYERELKRQLEKKGRLKITMVNPWGSVFGVRTGTDWAFYLQENATIVTNYVDKKTVKVVYYARPMQLTRIYPASPSRIATMRHQVPVRVE